MQATGDDYIFIEEPEEGIACPESLSVSLCDRNKGIGGYGIVLIGPSKIADARMRLYNRDGTDGGMGGNAIRCVAKYLYDTGRVRKKEMRIETSVGVKELRLYTSGEEVSMVTVKMGRPEFRPSLVPVDLPGERILDQPVRIADGRYSISCLSLGNPHCVVFVDRVDRFPVETVGPLFEHAELFPQRVNTEFVRVVNRNMLKMRVYERGNGETNACGTGACAAVIAAVENGLCEKGETVTVKVRGGDLLVVYDDDGVTLTGDAVLVYRGSFRY
jgi:carbamoyl-phosphate synthase large subunit